MGKQIEVSKDNFEQVINISKEKLVLIDFYATWCGPCQILKNQLEKLLQEYNFVLAKIDIDRNRELAHQFNVEGVPDVKIAAGGEIKPGFVGVIPEAELRELLAKFNLKSDLESQLEQIDKLKAAGDWKQVKQTFDQLFEQYPQHPRVAIEAARWLIEIDRLEAAEKMLNTAESQPESAAEIKALRGLIWLKQQAADGVTTPLAQKFTEAVKLTLKTEYEAALKLLLDIVASDRQYKDDGARKAMIAIFNLLGVDHPLTKQYQRQLMMTLY